jgi:putative hydrolase of HD superfamily
MPKPKEVKYILNYLAEAGQLKRVKRSGWWVVGIKDPESVSEHSHRTAIFAYILAKMEKVNPYPVLLMALFHDIHEARINDLHKVSQRYVNLKEGERKAIKEQLKPLPKDIRAELALILNNYDKQASKEALIARDADILECVLQAKEYFDFGHAKTKPFINVGSFLKTKSAKSIFKQIPSWDSQNWWLNLKNFQR